MMLALALILLAAPAPSASPTPAPSAAAQGTWGGLGLRVDAGPDGAEIDLDGAHGKTEGPLVPDAAGRFDVAGTIVREKPGPVRKGDPAPPAVPVRYRGTFDGDALTLEVVPAGDGKVLGPLTARRGAPARVRKMY
jgi:hypothetical protein